MAAKTENRDGTKYEWVPSKRRQIVEKLGMWNVLLLVLLTIITISTESRLLAVFAGFDYIVMFGFAIYTINNKERDKYTQELYDRVDKKIKECTTSDEYWELYNYFWKQAYEYTSDKCTSGMCRISWGTTTKEYLRKLEVAAVTAQNIEKKQAVTVQNIEKKQKEDYWKKCNHPKQKIRDEEGLHEFCNICNKEWTICKEDIKE